jgi:RNA recognition motif-containing protein
MNIYVGNLPYQVDGAELQQIFSQYGQVQNASVIMDRETGRSRGFGFVEMPNDDEAQQAITALHEKDFSGRPLKVNEARPKAERPRGSFGNSSDRRGFSQNRFGNR